MCGAAAVVSDEMCRGRLDRSAPQWDRLATIEQGVATMGCVPSGLCVVALAVAACGSSRPAPLADASGGIDAGGGIDGGASDAGTLPVDLELLAGDPHGPGTVDGTGGAAHFQNPNGVAADSAGNVYVADTNNQTIRKITPAGVVTTLAGTAEMSGSADGTGAAARFAAPTGVAIDAAGNLYVVEEINSTIRKVTPEGVVSTLAGVAGMRGSADGTGVTARFNFPEGIAVDGAGNVYVADRENDTIRKITPSGVVTTLAGAATMQGSTDGTGAAARFSLPAGIAVDGAGNIYVTEIGNLTIRKITPAGVVTTVAGAAGQFGSADGTGTAARFAQPLSVAVDAAGNLYVADTVNDTIRKITPAGVVTTLAGSASQFGSVDGTGAAARFQAPAGVAADSGGNVYVVDSQNRTIRTVTLAGVVTTVAGTAGMSGSADGTGAAARFNFPQGIAVDGVGNVYVADEVNHNIRKITPDAVVTTLAGAATMRGSADGEGTAARFFAPLGTATDGAGNVYVADTGNSTIRKVTPDGVVSTLAGVAGMSGSADGTGAAARFRSPRGVAVDSASNFYVADTGNRTIRKITPAGVVTTLAGAAGLFGSADGMGAAARFISPISVAVDGTGNVYVTDQFGNTIRKVTPTGMTTTIAGTPGAAGILLGTAPRLAFPQGLAIAGDSLIISDTNAILQLHLGAR
jgi:NHL repeat